MKKISVIGLLVSVFFIFASCSGEESNSNIISEYKFNTNGMELSVGENADGVISRLMEPNYSSCAPSCAGIGQDEVYIYNGFKISVYREGEDAEITAIEITNDATSTAEGIYIGDVEASLVAAYGEGRPFEGGVEYFGENCTLRFYLKNGRISAIKYLKSTS